MADLTYEAPMHCICEGLAKKFAENLEAETAMETSHWADNIVVIIKNESGCMN